MIRRWGGCWNKPAKCRGFPAEVFKYCEFISPFIPNAKSRFPPRIERNCYKSCCLRQLRRHPDLAFEIRLCRSGGVLAFHAPVRIADRHERGGLQGVLDARYRCGNSAAWAWNATACSSRRALIPIPTSERTWKPPSKICGTRRGSACRSAARSKRSSYPPGRGQSDFAVVAGTAGEGV